MADATTEDHAAAQEREDRIDALAAQMFTDLHPGEAFTAQPWDIQANFFHSARLVLTP